jgi:hypothetical protein
MTTGNARYTPPNFVASPTTRPDPAPRLGPTCGAIREVICDFTFDRLPQQSTTDALVHSFPTGAVFIDAVLLTKETWAGGTSLEVGLDTTAGVPFSPAGFITAVVGVTANLSAGTAIRGRGALVSVEDADGVLSVTQIPGLSTQLNINAVGTFTAGRSKLIIRYYEPTA